MNKECNFMIDIEALGIAETSIILSIGAHCLETAEGFYVELDIGRQGIRTTDLDTLKWWLNQDTKIPVNGTANLSDALRSLAQFIQCPDGMVPSVWANGSDYDFKILANAYNLQNLQIPWKYNSVRDYRTLSKLLPHIKRAEFTGTKHNALDDATNQAAHLKLLLEEVEKWTPIPPI